MGTMETGVVRQLVKVSDGRVGAITANDRAGGVLRGHCDLFFGEIDEDGKPIIEQLCMSDDWEAIPVSFGTSR